MEDFDTFNRVVEESVRTTSYRSAIISSIIFLVYTIVIKITDYYKSKNKNKPMIEMANAIKEVSNNVMKQNSILDKFIQDNIRKDINKSKTVVELVFVKFKNNVDNNVKDIIIRNNVELNRELIQSNLKQFITTEFYRMVSVFNMYEVNDIPISTYLKEKWITDTYDSLIEIIYNKQPKDKRVLQVSSKLQMNIDKYITYINNKLF